MPFTKELTIEGYESFQSKIKLLETEAAKQPLYILFTGSEGPDGKSWCPDCVEFEKVWETFITKNPPEQGYFVRVKVGPREIWKDKNCPFRTDKTLRLTSIPTLIKWGSPQRLSDDQILNPECLAMLMEDDD